MQSSLQTKLAVFVIIGTVLSSAYFIYYWYQSYQYVEQLMPLYRSLELLGRDEDRLIAGEQNPEELLRETDRIARSAEELKALCQEIPLTNNRSGKVNETFVGTTDRLLAWNQSTKAFLQAQAQYLTEKNLQSPQAPAAQKLAEAKQLESTRAGEEYRKIMKTQLSRILGVTR
ncbi:MAG TPA: hypothetical protein PKA10_10325 [Selenomonadales bacterium]|nr:hypothetical protein [Selenomonadales bacterium]